MIENMIENDCIISPGFTIWTYKNNTVKMSVN